MCSILRLDDGQVPALTGPLSRIRSGSCSADAGIIQALSTCSRRSSERSWRGEAKEGNTGSHLLSLSSRQCSSGRKTSCANCWLLPCIKGPEGTDQGTFTFTHTVGKLLSRILLESRNGPESFWNTVDQEEHEVSYSIIQKKFCFENRFDLFLKASQGDFYHFGY